MSINLVFDSFQNYILSKISPDATQLLVDKTLIATSNEGEQKLDLNQMVNDTPIEVKQ